MVSGISQNIPDIFSAFYLTPEAYIIDVVGGDSHFIDALLEKGYRNIFLLDILVNAIERAEKRLGEKAKFVTFIVSDIPDYLPTVKFNFWHDRAAFHFLTSEEQINKYVSIAESEINPGGYLILGTFSEKGPVKCSGLEIKQYRMASMSS